MQYKLAKIEDIEKVLELHFKYQIDSIKEEVIKEFSYNNNNYYELVYDTSKKLRNL